VDMLGSRRERGLSTRYLLRKDGSLSYGLDKSIRNCLRRDIAGLTDVSEVRALLDTAEEVGSYVAREAWVKGTDELLEAEEKRQAQAALN
jgi:hypothetical protein